MRRFMFSLLALFVSTTIAQGAINNHNEYEFNGEELGVYYATNNVATEDEKIYDVVEQMPTYRGGQRTLLEYIRDNIKYPIAAQEAGVEGKVIVRFVVKKDGTVGDTQIFSGSTPELNQEAIRVVKSITGFIPGYQNGKPVNVWHTVPVSFKLM